MNTRNEDIKTLQEMQTIQRELQNVSKALKQLDKSENDVSIDYNQYKTHHADECEMERDDALKESADAFTKQKKSAVAKLSLIPWIGIAAAIAIIVFVKNVWLGISIGILGFIIKSIPKHIISKRISKEANAEAAKITAAYKIKLDKALEEDEKEKHRYESDLKIAREKCREKNQSARETLEKQAKEYENNLNKIKIISDNDMENIPMLINILKGNRADNIREALLFLDEQKRRKKEEEIRRKEEAERRRQAEEAERRRQAEKAARLASMPGTVHVRIGSINTYSGKLQTVRNSIYFDGAHYGPGDATGTTTFQLNPGIHNVYAQLQEAGYIFTSQNLSFTLPGNGDVYVKIIIKNARASIYLCSSESDFWSN